MTVDDFLALPEEETYGKELIDGEIVDMGNSGKHHEWIKALTNRLIVSALLKEGRYLVMGEAVFHPDDDELTGLKPDLALVPASPPNAPNRDRIYPILAVEIVSSDRASRLHDKIRIYFEMGSQAVWVLYASDHTIEVHKPDGTSRKLRRDDWIEAPGIISDFRVKVSDFFQGID